MNAKIMKLQATMVICALFLFQAIHAFSDTGSNLTAPGKKEMTNVRALKAWNLIPDFSYAVAIALKQKGLDILNATPDDIQKWLDNENITLSDDQRKSLEYVLSEFKKIDSNIQEDNKSSIVNKEKPRFSDFLNSDVIDKMYYDLKLSKVDSYKSIFELFLELEDSENSYLEFKNSVNLLEKTKVTKLAIQYFASPFQAVDSNENIINFVNPKNYGEQSVNFNTVEYYKVYPKEDDLGGRLSDSEFIAEDIHPGKESARAVHEKLESDKIQVKNAIDNTSKKIQALKAESLSRLFKIEKNLFTATDADVSDFFQQSFDYACAIQSDYHELNGNSSSGKYNEFTAGVNSAETVDASIRKKTDAIFDFHFAKYLSFDGFIHTDIPVRMNILIDGKQVRGYYWYKKVGIPIPIRGTIDDTFRMNLEESSDIPSSGSKSTGRFVCYMACDFSAIRGVWESETKKFPFDLKRNQRVADMFSEIKSSALHTEGENLFSYIAIVPKRDKLSEYANFLSINQYDNMSVEDFIGTQKVAAIARNMSEDDVFSTKTEEQIIFNSHSFFSKEIYASVYDGGVHGSYKYSYINYDVINHVNVNLQKIYSAFGLSSGKLAGLINLHARKHFNVLPNASMKESAEGYFYVDDFPVSDTFYLCKKGIVFVYNPYEVAPYAGGVTKILVPWSDLKAHATREGKTLLERLEEE